MAGRKKSKKKVDKRLADMKASGISMQSLEGKRGAAAARGKHKKKTT